RRAYSTVGCLKYTDLEALLQSRDEDALGGLASNRPLSVEGLKKVRNRLQEMGDYGVMGADATIEWIQKTRPPEDPEELFGWGGRNGKFLQDKIDFIGKRLLSFQEEVAEQIQELN